MKKKEYCIGNIKNFSNYKGWFMGQFIDSNKYPLLKSDKVEIAWKKLPENFTDKTHIHKRAIEVNIVIAGWFEVIINEKKLKIIKGQFYVIYPYTTLSITKVKKGAQVIVIKFPSVKDDKFIR